jgi:hypothetical protein
MERKMKTPLSYNREAYRLWFEYLRVAHKDRRPEVQRALESSKQFYEPWGDVTNAKFDDWWKEKRLLFAEKYVVRQLAAGEAPTDPEALIVEIPLRQSPSILVKRVAELIREASANRPRSGKKGGKAPTSDYKLSGGAEPKVDPLREMLTLFRDVYLKNPKAKGKQLLDALEQLYLSRKQSRFAKVPKPFQIPLDAKLKKLDRVLRNVNRYVNRAKKIVLNVANGEFPGRY